MTYLKFDIKELRVAIEKAVKDGAISVSLTEEVNTHKLLISYSDASDRSITISVPPANSELFAEITIKERLSLKD